MDQKFETNKTITRLLNENLPATGVIFNGSNEITRIARTWLEIIVFRGAIGSPRPLQSSGIGFGHVLGMARIPALHKLSGIGQNLIDRLEILSTLDIIRPITLSDFNGSMIKCGIPVMRYLRFQLKPLTVGAGQAAAYSRKDLFPERPEMAFTFSAFSTSGPGRKQCEIPGFNLPLYPIPIRCRRTFRLASHDIRQARKIDPARQSDERVREMLIEGLESSRANVVQNKLKGMIAKEKMPSRAVQAKWDLIAYIRSSATSVFRSVATCSTGREGKRESVVGHVGCASRVSRGCGRPTLRLCRYPS